MYCNSRHSRFAPNVPAAAPAVFAHFSPPAPATSLLKHFQGGSANETFLGAGAVRSPGLVKIDKVDDGKNPHAVERAGHSRASRPRLTHRPSGVFNFRYCFKSKNRGYTVRKISTVKFRVAAAGVESA